MVATILSMDPQKKKGRVVHIGQKKPRVFFYPLFRLCPEINSGMYQSIRGVLVVV